MDRHTEAWTRFSLRSHRLINELLSSRKLQHKASTLKARLDNNNNAKQRHRKKFFIRFLEGCSTISETLFNIDPKVCLIPLNVCTFQLRTGFSLFAYVFLLFAVILLSCFHYNVVKFQVDTLLGQRRCGFWLGQRFLLAVLKLNTV